MDSRGRVVWIDFRKFGAFIHSQWLTLQTNLRFKLGEEIDKFRTILNINKTKLEEWLTLTAEKDEDFMTFQKYKRLDESKVNELNLQINYLLEEVKNQKNALDVEATETQSVQIALDKTAEEFRRSHLERHELIERWERTLNLMKKRDDDMESLNNQIHLLKLRILQKEHEIAEKKRFYDNEVENNKELDVKIQMTNKTASKFRQDYQEKEEQRIQFASELDALKKTVDRTATDLEASRSQVAELKKETNDSTKRNELLTEKYEEMKEKLDIVTKSSMSAKEAADQLEILLLKEEKDKEKLEADLRELRSLKYRKEQELKANQDDLKVLEMKANNSRVAIRNMENKIYRLDQDALKQEALLYTQDLAIDSLNKRIASMEGEVDLDDLNQKKADIKSLTEALEEKKSTHKMLEGQLNRLKDDTFKIESDISKHSGEMEDLIKKIADITLFNESSDKLLKKNIRENQELLVKENMEKAEVKRLQKLLYDEAFKVLTQEERKLQIETVKKERKHEIKIHNDMLLSQIKVVETERQTINMELHERQAKLKKLGARHEILTSAMAPSDGEEEKSQAYYVIKAAQEKEELQVIGDELDAKIHKAEKENRALDNTIKLLNSSNESYRKSFNRVEENSQEMEEKKTLDEKLHVVQDELRLKKRRCKELNEDLETMESTLNHKKRESATLKEFVNCKKEEYK
ncbi:Hypothetical predicted protein [Octopus vulgaris]|uniref:Coiled-coil domain-containing protein 39 n=1 Tax=Octopus vulgaris TaxID=6645 RepID=A0AA36FHB4_OCTVU|nr:Hypothetical predicted protein [Octopus vulgaris]